MLAYRNPSKRVPICFEDTLKLCAYWIPMRYANYGFYNSLKDLKADSICNFETALRSY